MLCFLLAVAFLVHAFFPKNALLFCLGLPTSNKYYGPYKLLQNIGTMAYKLELLASSRVHPVFHVSCLKKVIGDKISVQTIFPEPDEEGKIIWKPEAITDTRIRQLRNTSISKYLIKWKKLLAEDSTREDESFIQKHPELLKR
jgi:hypothetical protein